MSHELNPERWGRISVFEERSYEPEDHCYKKLESQNVHAMFEE